ncbi:MAG TPA: sulfotransferase [Pirellulales bacterium]|nr:sulfotransferase [Pirellulales bacterium]
MPRLNEHVNPIAPAAPAAENRATDIERTRHFVFLLGTARSGTTWLGNILNSSPRSIYSHEPLVRYPDEELLPVLKRIKKTGLATPDEREMVLHHWSRAYFDVRRPPFFTKDYSAWPAGVPWAAWLAVRAAGRGYNTFQRLFSPRNGARYDLVAKQGGLAVDGPNIVQALTPQVLIVIVRHPCAVIASLRRGQKLGLMARPSRDRWLDDHLPLIEGLGYGRRHAEAMSEAEFQSLAWLVENYVYQKLHDTHPNAHIVPYDDLCRDPIGVTRSLFQAIGWDVTRQTHRFLCHTTLRRTNRLTSLVTAGHSYFSVYKSGEGTADSWKRDLDQSEQDEILAIARPLVERYWPEALGQ